MKLKPHDPKHPYVLRFVGCGHGVLFKDYCRDCEIIGLQEQHRWATKQVQKCEQRLKELGDKK